MKKYTFRYHSDNWVDITVTAEDQETARMLADERYNNGQYDDTDTDFENTHCDLQSVEEVGDEIMDTSNGHDPELVRRINEKWNENAIAFTDVLLALMRRDLTEILCSDAFPDLPDYRVEAYEVLRNHTDKYARNYLMHIADDKDLKYILSYFRIHGDKIKPAPERKVLTCRGVFTIKGNMAFPADAETEDEFGDEVVLPKPDMTNDEIKDYFRLLEEENEEEKKRQIRKLLLTKISEVGFSVRTSNYLMVDNINTIADIVSHSRKELSKMGHCTKKTLTEIDAMLEKMKLSFGMDLSEYDLKPKAKNVIRLAIIDHNTHTLHIDEVDEELINSKYEGEEERYIDEVYGFGNYSWDYIVNVKNKQ